MMLLVGLLAVPLVATAQSTDDAKVMETKLDVCKWQLETTSTRLSQALAQANGRVEVLQKELAAAKPPAPPTGEKPPPGGEGK